MMPINFKYKKLSEKELLELSNSKYTNESPKSRYSDSLYYKRNQFQQRQQNEYDTLGSVRRVTEEAKDKCEQMKKKVKKILIEEELQQGKQKLLNDKIKFMETIKARKNKDQELLQKLKQQYYERQQQMTQSVKTLRDQLSLEIKRSKENLLQSKKQDQEEIMKQRKENEQMIKQFSGTVIEKKKEQINRVKNDKEISYQTKCKFFEQKKLNWQRINQEKRREYQTEQTWILEEINELEKEEQKALSRYNSLQQSRLEKQSFLSTFMGAKKSFQQEGFSSRNSIENSPIRTIHDSGEKQKFVNA
ncbi:hypothetical protein TTHERM_00299790 (macronuclear) [Tetrahymena thermophila SB210]|uniref:Uncharacterized protein n=1 Tax=Tetrahymena thermophila (strain SB210) TaxID=312017 RepID=I7MAB3_TETTS|nr:hypothetical protein TTHERM_00299790 [Tetrahymena thermophila SB210]EAS04261.1 hypothetical protein TTHERM_00299790 [Tetrahymena thermophila SB210]|eukprot:XP_001024506.1 hypothetical protein TTHERM_00299790 [Tetrahymena thermophila SB210]